jgi:hypothetical protein
MIDNGQKYRRYSPTWDSGLVCENCFQRILNLITIAFSFGGYDLENGLAIKFQSITSFKIVEKKLHDETITSGLVISSIG